MKACWFLTRPFIFCFFLLCALLNTTRAQQFYDDDLPVVSFGLQVSPLFTTNLLNIRANETDLDGITMGIDPLFGYSIGGIVNFRLNRSFFLQTGINMMRRNQRAFVSGNGIDESVRMRFLIYEIPIFASYYLRLTESSFLSLSSGLPIQMAPTALFSMNGNIAAESLKIGILRPVSTTILGFEKRTLLHGGWFVGFSYTIAPWHLFLTKVIYQTEPTNKEFVFRHIGDHAGLVFRYYFK
jgi:hypothetical protein